ncbi:hypothetical protein LTR86_006623 [Recurvomyces mirabilis]|nr:hypothetical protein LTR86_006623 [Recurvomyces mirabilis]
MATITHSAALRLLTIFYLSLAVTASPLGPWCPSSLSADLAHSDAGRQRIFQDPMTYSSPTAQPRLLNYLDASANSVGLLITGEDAEGEEEAVHVWLPLGKRVRTLDAPELPLRPLTARITTMIRSTPQIATPEHLERVVCRIFPKQVRSSWEMEKQEADSVPVIVRRTDELLRLVSRSGEPMGEVEAYECA